MFCSCTWERQEADERASALDGVGKQTEEEEGEELLRLRPSVGRPPSRSQPWERERVRLSPLSLPLRTALPPPIPSSFARPFPFVSSPSSFTPARPPPSSTRPRWPPPPPPPPPRTGAGNEEGWVPTTGAGVSTPDGRTDAQKSKGGRRRGKAER